MDLSDSDLDIDLEDSEVLRNLFDSKKSPSSKKSSAETAATSSKRSSQKSKNETKEEVFSDLEEMPTPNLRLLLNANGLPVAGERPDLISRIKIHFGLAGSSERKRGAALIEGTKSNHL